MAESLLDGGDAVADRAFMDTQPRAGGCGAVAAVDVRAQGIEEDLCAFSAVEQRAELALGELAGGAFVAQCERFEGEVVVAAARLAGVAQDARGLERLAVAAPEAVGIASGRAERDRCVGGEGEL